MEKWLMLNQIGIDRAVRPLDYVPTNDGYLIELQGMIVRVFACRPGFIPRSSHTKDSKNSTWCLLA